MSDADAYIDSLTQLIAKKQAIKQGAMQTLLTGQQRLPGFSGAWVVKHLGEVAHVKTGSLNNEDKIDGGIYPFYVRSDTVEAINHYTHHCEAILVPGEGGIGNIFHYIDGKFSVHQRVYVISKFEEHTVGKFIYLYMKQYFGEHAMKNSVKATVDSLRLPTFQDFQMKIPATKAEQTAIAAVLSDLDTELAAVQAQLSKAQAVKQGMMQQLLTGKRRLV